METNDNVAIAPSEPWAFTQQHPLTTTEFCKEARRRDVELNNGLLRELWRIGAVAPLAEVRRRRVGTGRPSSLPEPPGSTWQVELRRARNTGRLADPEKLGFRHQLRFDRPRAALSHNRKWWNGLFYSRWQLLAVDWFRDVLARVPPVARGGGAPRLPVLNEHGRDEAARLRRLAELLVALEARYLPEIKHPWVHLTGASFEEWEAYRRQFVPADVLARLKWTPEQVVRTADRLLLGVRRKDPLSREWSQLVRRAASRAWDDLTGTALAALDIRIAAEVLLLCYEDMAARGEAPDLESCGDWFSFQSERLNHTDVSLDGNLASLGLSPHPGVVFVIEGETEEALVPRVQSRLRMTDDAGIVRSVVMRGTKAGLAKLVAFAAGPLIERDTGDGWLLAKPPTRIFVTVDPDRPFHTPEAVEGERRKMVDEIVAVIRAQGVEPEREDVDYLVDIETWNESCFEFAHFTDDELAAALGILHPNCGGLSPARLTRALGKHRAHRQDVGKVWVNWSPVPSKRRLADELWPVLERRITAAEDNQDAEVPEVVLRLQDAHYQAASRPAGRWFLRGRRIVEPAESPEVQ